MDENTEGRIADLKDDVAELEVDVARLTEEVRQLTFAKEAADYAAVAGAEAVGAMAEKLSAVMAERDRLRDEVDMYQDRALPDAARIMNGMSEALGEVEAERDRLRAVVDAEIKYRAVMGARVEAFNGGPDLEAEAALAGEARVRREALDDALARLDVGEATDGFTSGSPDVEVEQLRTRAEQAERQLAEVYQLINDSVAKVLDAAGPEDENNPVIQRLRALDVSGDMGGE